MVLRKLEMMALFSTPSAFHAHMVCGETPIAIARALLPLIVSLLILLVVLYSWRPEEFNLRECPAVAEHSDALPPYDPALTYLTYVKNQTS